MIQIRKETKSNFKKQTSIFPNLKSVAVHPGAQRSVFLFCIRNLTLAFKSSISDYGVDSNYNLTGSGPWNREEVTRL
ncbi:hypothetical protein QRD38_15175, partial [Leptospira weilii]|nr:hypothetical protein [Leptospira weilii]